MQLIDLKSVESNIYRVEKQIGRVGGPEMYVQNVTKVDSFERNAASRGTYIRRME